MSRKLFLFGRWWRLDVVVFVMCPMVITVGQVLDWIFGFFGSSSGSSGWIVGATEG